MYAINYERPASAADATRIAASGAKTLAGGQTLLASMKLRLESPPSLADLSGIAEIASGVRVAVTGGGNGVFSHAGLGAALSKTFTAQVAAVPVDAAEMNSKIHGSATYRANLVGMLTQRAVTKALG